MSAVTKVNVATQTMSFEELFQEELRKRQHEGEVVEKEAAMLQRNR